MERRPTAGGGGSSENWKTQKGEGEIFWMTSVWEILLDDSRRGVKNGSKSLRPF